MKSIDFLKLEKLHKGWFDEFLFFFFFSERISRFSSLHWKLRNFTARHSVVISGIFPHWNFFSSNWFTVNLTEFLQKIVGEKFANFHTVMPTIFSQKFRQINILLKNSTINWFDGQFCVVVVNFSFLHTVCWTVWKLHGNLLSLFLYKNFVKVMILLTKLQNSWFDEIYLMRVNFSFFNRACW